MPHAEVNCSEPGTTDADISVRLLRLSDRLQVIESVAAILADALLSDSFEPTSEHGTRVLHLHVCEPLRIEIENLSQWARSAQRESSSNQKEVLPGEERP